jgi:hypothetical protein
MNIFLTFPKKIRISIRQEWRKNPKQWNWFFPFVERGRIKMKVNLDFLRQIEIK